MTSFARAREIDGVGRADLDRLSTQVLPATRLFQSSRCGARTPSGKCETRLTGDNQLVLSLEIKFEDRKVKAFCFSTGDLSDHDSHKYVSIMNHGIKQIALVLSCALS